MAESVATFNTAFVEQRMREHREWQEQTACIYAAQIISEVLDTEEHEYEHELAN